MGWRGCVFIHAPTLTLVTGVCVCVCVCTPTVWLRQLSWPGGVEGACVLGSVGQTDRTPGIRLAGLITHNTPSRRQTPADLQDFLSHRPICTCTPSFSLLLSLLGKLGVNHWAAAEILSVLMFYSTWAVALFLNGIMPGFDVKRRNTGLQLCHWEESTWGYLKICLY